MRIMLKTAAIGAAALALAMAAVAAPQNATKPSVNDTKPLPKVGDKAPAWKLTDTNGKTHELKDFKGKTVVIEWTNPDCPFVVGVYKHGIVKQTVDAMKKMGDDYVYLTINSTGNKPKDDVVAENTAFLKEHKIDVPVLIDHDGTVGMAYGARHTPDLYIIDGKGVIRYIGGYTDDRRFANGTDATNYVVNALEQIKAGETVAPDETRRWGCSVKYAKK